MLLAANRTGGQVRTDFSVFPTPQFARVSCIAGFQKLLNLFIMIFLLSF